MARPPPPRRLPGRVVTDTGQDGADRPGRPHRPGARGVRGPGRRAGAAGLRRRRRHGGEMGSGRLWVDFPLCEDVTVARGAVTAARAAQRYMAGASTADVAVLELAEPV